MSSTVVHPESVSGKRLPRKTIGMAVAGVVVAAALGFAIADQSALEVVEGQASVQINSADIRFQQEAAEIAAERQALLQQATTGVVPQTPIERQNAQWESKAQFLEDQYRAQNVHKPTSGPR